MGFVDELIWGDLMDWKSGECRRRKEVAIYITRMDFDVHEWCVIASLYLFCLPTLYNTDAVAPVT